MRIRNMLIIAIGLVARTGFAQPANPVDQATVNYLKTLLNADGGYSPTAGQPGNPVRSSLRATSATCRALKYLGSTPPDLPATLGFVERCKDVTTGGFGDFPGDPPTVTLTAIGAMTAIDLNVPPELYRDGVIKYLDEHTKTLEEIRIVAAAFEALKVRSAKTDDWLRQIAATAGADGTFGTGTGVARATGGTAVMILRLGGKLDRRDAILKAMRDGQRPDGGFGSADRAGSDLESTYRVMRGFAMLKEKPSDPAKLRTFIASCRAATGGYGVTPGQPPSASGTYYAAIVLHWLDQR